MVASKAETSALKGEWGSVALMAVIGSTPGDGLSGFISKSCGELSTNPVINDINIREAQVSGMSAFHVSGVSSDINTLPSAGASKNNSDRQL